MLFYLSSLIIFATERVSRFLIWYGHLCGHQVLPGWFSQDRYINPEIRVSHEN